MGELVLFESCNHLPEFVTGELAHVFFKDGLRGFRRWLVEQHDRRHVLSERFRDAGELLGQHPHTDAGMARRESAFDQIPCPPFDVFRGGSVIRDDESVGSFETKTGHFQPKFNPVLLADN